MEFRSITEDDYDAVRQFLAEVGWRERVRDRARFGRMLRHTSRTVAAFEGGRVVGFARAVCDEASNGYVSMVAVAEDLRGRGVGRELVRRLIGDDTGITWVLRAGRGSDGFWEKIGFKRSSVAMERVRE